MPNISKEIRNPGTDFETPVFLRSLAIYPLLFSLGEFGVPFPPQNILVDFLWGALGVLTVAALVLTVITQWKKAFGRVPSLDQILSGLATLKHVEEANGKISVLSNRVQQLPTAKDVAEAERQRADIRDELHSRSRGLEEQVAKLRHDVKSEYQAILNNSQLRQEKTDEKFAIIRSDIAKLNERTETHIRSNDRLETVMQNLMREIGRVSGRKAS